MKLSIVIPCLNQFPITNQAIKYLVESREQESDFDIIVLDNGSDEEFKTDLPGVSVVRYDEPIGSYRAFKYGFEETDADIVAFLHSDVFVYEKGWSKRVIAEFERDARLGMIGFVGSNEIDSMGGRGLGTTSNFQGRIIESIEGQLVYKWTGSPALVHGKQNAGFTNAAIVDGCVMIIRKTAWEDIGFREDMGIHHFYDKLISTQLLEKNWHIGILGIEFDHVSGQTVNAEPKYKDACKKWLQENHITPGGLGVNWDNEMYKYSEHYWLKEYRDIKHFIPLKVNEK